MPNIVCVSIERSVELIVAMIAIQLAGLSLLSRARQPSHSAQGRAVHADGVQCSADPTASTPTTASHKHVDAASTEQGRLDIVQVDELLSRAADTPRQHGHTGRAADLPDEQHLNDLSRPAYAIFTSGTTGKPKAAVISHLRHLATFTACHARSCRMVQPGSCRAAGQ